MKGKLKVGLGPVQETLLLPLWARAKEMEKPRPIVADPCAKDIIEKVDYDFSRFEAEPEIANNQQLMWAIRAFNFDNIVQRFIQQHENVVVINIGAGLDTAFQRVDNGRAQWIHIDLPDVVALRIANRSYTEVAPG